MPTTDVAEDAQSFTAALVAVRAAADAPERLALLEALLAALKAQTVRDIEPDQPLFDALFGLLDAALQSTFKPDAAHAANVLTVGILALPEFAVDGITIGDAFLDLCFERLSQPARDDPSWPVPGVGLGGGGSGAKLPGGVRMVSGGALSPAQAKRVGGSAAAASAAATPAGPSASDVAQELITARAVLEWSYRHQPALRAGLRSRMGRCLLQMSSGGVPPPGLRLLLQLLSTIIAGFGLPTAAHRGLLQSVLVPLHRPAGRLDETTPHLSLYHEPLVHTMVLLLKAQPQHLVAALSGLLSLWPLPQDGNSAKEVLLLHELEQILVSYTMFVDTIYIYLSVYLSTSINLCIYPCIYLSIYVFMYVYINLSVHLYMFIIYI